MLTFLEMEDRIELANLSGLISNSCASNMRTVNTIRNKLAHYHPKQGWQVSYVQELSSAKAFDQCTNKGLAALKEALHTMSQRMDERDYKPDEQ